MQAQWTPPKSTLVEIGILFIPAIPAYSWVWPNLSGIGLWIFQIVSYIYVLAGTLWIIRRHWSIKQVGLHWQGFTMSLVCGVVILAGRQLIISSIEWGSNPDPPSVLEIIGLATFYFVCVGLTEELLFRGLVYTAIETWSGERWAIWGSSLGFLLWHIFGQGVVIGLTSFVIGLAFALFRSRLGGILGLIILHAIWDLQSTLQIAGSNEDILEVLPPLITHPAWLRLGTGVMILPVLYLWLIHPHLVRRRQLANSDSSPGEQLPSK